MNAIEQWEAVLYGDSWRSTSFAASRGRWLPMNSPSVKGWPPPTTR